MRTQERLMPPLVSFSFIFPQSYSLLIFADNSACSSIIDRQEISRIKARIKAAWAAANDHKLGSFILLHISWTFSIPSAALHFIGYLVASLSRCPKRCSSSRSNSGSFLNQRECSMSSNQNCKILSIAWSCMIFSLFDIAQYYDNPISVHQESSWLEKLNVS